MGGAVDLRRLSIRGQFVDAHRLQLATDDRSQPDDADARIKDLRDPEVAALELRECILHDLHVLLRHRPPSICRRWEAGNPSRPATRPVLKLTARLGG